MAMKTGIMALALAASLLYSGDLLNGGFEKASPSPDLKRVVQEHAEGWQLILNAGVGKVRGDLSGESHGGSRSMHLVAHEPKSYIGLYQDVSCSPDTELRLSAWFKGTQGARTYFRIWFFDASGKRNDKYLMPGWLMPDSETWVKREYIFQVPAYARKMRVGIETLGNMFPDAEIYVDDVTLESKAGPVLQNAFLRAEINPLCGGCIDSLTGVFGGRTVEFTRRRTVNSTGGMAVEIIPMKRNPGFFSNKTYELQVLEPFRRIQVSRLAQDGDVKGLLVRKTFTLAPSSLSVDVKLELVNTGETALETSCRVQNILAASDGYVCSPTRDWLQVFHKTSESIQTTNAVNSNNLQGGYLTKTTADAAVIGEFDVGQASGGYNWVSKEIDTMEWQYENIRLEPHKAFSISYRLHIAPSPQPVIGLNGAYVLSVDSLDKPTSLTVSALSDGASRMTLNGEEQSLPVKAGASLSYAVGSGVIEAVIDGRSTSYGKTYKALFIRGIKLPPPVKASATPRFDRYFPFIFNGDVALTWKESTGVDGRSAQFLRSSEIAFRECSAGGFNAGMQGRIIQQGILEVANRPDGTNDIGEWCRKYGVGFFVNTHLIQKNDIDQAKFRPELSKRLEMFYRPAMLDFLRRYDDVMKAVFTADETTAQNIPCMLEAHERLQAVLPIDIPVYPYLNIHSSVYMPYVPVFFGDWYPINRKENGGRNPWSVAKVTARTVEQAKGLPVHVILQCFGYFKKGYGLPTPEEYRLMCHLTVANGAKGIEAHEVNNRGLSWRYNYGYHYAARGNAGEYTPLWFAMMECAREVTAVGTQVTDMHPVAVPGWLGLYSPVYRSANGFYDGPQVMFYALGRDDGTMMLVAVNHSEKDGIVQKMDFKAPKGVSVASLTAMKAVSGPYEAVLEAGGAEYFIAGTEDAVQKAVNEVALSRAERKGVAFRIAADRACGNGVDLAKAVVLAKQSSEQQASGEGLKALAAIDAAEAARSALVAASDFGAFDASWDKARRELSDVCFLFLTHFDLVIPPALREKTGRYERWNNTADPKMQQLVDDVASCWTEYWQIEQEIVEGRLSKHRGRAEALIHKAHAAAEAATAYLKANASRITVDTPYSE